jgi:hypothetical protein
MSFMTIPFVEVEVRLGTINTNKAFDSSVNKEYFQKIHSIYLR